MTLVNEEPGVGERPLALRSERAPFVMLPRWLLHHPRVTEGAKVLYCVLHDLVNGREGPTRPVTRAQLADLCGVSVDTIDRRLAQLVAARAVEKQAQIPAGGQQANVYQVWLTPPDGLLRTAGTPPEEPENDRSRNHAAPVESPANPQVNRRRESAALPQPCGPASRTDAAPTKEEQDQESPPQPPRPAGGPDLLTNQTNAGRRVAGTNPRALADRAEAEREEAEAQRRHAEFDAEAAVRQAEADAARAEADRFEAEATAISAALDDSVLHAIVDLIGETLAGPLATSPLAVTRAVVGWCRAASAAYPGPFEDAVDRALARIDLPVGDHPALQLPAAPVDTQPLRQRIATQLRR